MKSFLLRIKKLSSQGAKNWACHEKQLSKCCSWRGSYVDRVQIYHLLRNKKSTNAKKTMLGIVVANSTVAYRNRLDE